MNLWENIKRLLATKISSAAYENWLLRTSFLRLEGGVLWVSVPDDLTKEWLQQEYAGEVWSAIRDIGLPVAQVIYEAVSSQPIQGNPHGGDKSQEPIFAPSVSLNPKFTFDSFVVGSCN